MPDVTMTASPHGDNKTGHHTLSDSMLEILREWGAEYAMLVPGAQIDGFISALSHGNCPKPILACHELAAGYMADGYHRASGRIGLAMAIGGPGAANLLGAAGAAKSDGASILFVTGNIPASHQGLQSFQDAWPAGSNDAGLYAAAIGESHVCNRPDDLVDILQHARIALLNRQPVHICVPIDIQLAKMAKPLIERPPACMVPLAPIPEALRQGRVVLALGSCALDNLNVVRLREFVERHQLAVVTDLRTRGAIAEGEPCALGHLGFLPHPRAMAALSGTDTDTADTVVAIGFPAALQARYSGSLPWHALEPGTLHDWLASASPARPSNSVLDMRNAWLTRLSKIDRPDRMRSNAIEMNIGNILVSLGTHLPEDTIYCIDSGQARRIAVKTLRARTPRSLLSADGMSPMGWAIGAALGAPGRVVVALTGDGSMRMHGIEITTAARYHVPVIFVVCDNSCYGSIAARGEHLRKMADLPCVDWLAFAQSLNVRALRINNMKALAEAVSGFENCNGPLVLIAEVPRIDPDAFDEPDGIEWLQGQPK